MGPTHFLTYVIFVLLGGLALMAIMAVLRGFLEARAIPSKAGPKIPFIDFPPPPPVHPSAGVTQVGWSAAIWSTLNLVATLLWFATGFGAKEILPEYYLSAVYVLVAATISGIGGVLLLSCQAQGRRMISWGGFLFATITTMGFGFALIVRASPRTTPSDKTAAMWMTLLTGMHLVIDTVIASAAQRVGLPPKDEQPQPPAQPGE